MQQLTLHVREHWIDAYSSHGDFRLQRLSTPGVITGRAITFAESGATTSAGVFVRLTSDTDVDAYRSIIHQQEEPGITDINVWRDSQYANLRLPASGFSDVPDFYFANLDEAIKYIEWVDARNHALLCGTSHSTSKTA